MESIKKYKYILSYILSAPQIANDPAAEYKCKSSSGILPLKKCHMTAYCPAFCQVIHTNCFTPLRRKLCTSETAILLKKVTSFT